MCQDAGKLWEEDAANEWERINTNPKEKELAGALACANEAVRYLEETYESVAEAARWLEGTPHYDRLVSALNEIEDIEDEVRCLRRKFIRGDLE